MEKFNNTDEQSKSIDSFVNSVIQGDCLEVMKHFPNASIDMVLCDLPYGTTQNKWDSIIPLNELWLEYRRVVKRNGAIVLTSQGLFTAALILRGNGRRVRALRRRRVRHTSGTRCRRGRRRTLRKGSRTHRKNTLGGYLRLSRQREHRTLEVPRQRRHSIAYRARRQTNVQKQSRKGCGIGGNHYGKR